VCPHAPSCTKTYGHNHLLQRHIASSHPTNANPTHNPSHPFQISSSSHPSHLDPNPPFSHFSHDDPSNSDIDDAQLLGELTGTTYVSERKIACPYGREGVVLSATNQLVGAGGEGEEDESCGYRFSRAYDLRRHLGKVHGVVVDEEEARGLAEGLRKGRK